MKWENATVLFTVGDLVNNYYINNNKCLWISKLNSTLGNSTHQIGVITEIQSVEGIDIYLVATRAFNEYFPEDACSHGFNIMAVSGIPFEGNNFNFSSPGGAALHVAGSNNTMISIYFYVTPGYVADGNYGYAVDASNHMNSFAWY